MFGVFWLGRLEDPDAEEVKEFVHEQVTLTESVLKTCDTRDRLREKITKLFDHPRYYVPFKRGNKYFYFHNTGLQAQDVLYVQVLRARVRVFYGIVFVFERLVLMFLS